MAQMAFRLMYRKSQHQVAFLLDIYHLLIQYLGLQFGHQLLQVVQALGQRANTKGYLALNRGVRDGGINKKTQHKFELRLKLLSVIHGSTGLYGLGL
jgi:hypothetical protein